MPPSPARPKPRRRPRLVALGDLSLDIVVEPRAEIATGSDVDGTVTFRVGGSAANAARAFTRLGGDSTFVGAVGDDGLGRRLARALRADGVRVRVARAGGMPTARIVVVVGAGGERSFVTARGAADCLAPDHLRRAWFRRAGALHLPAYSLLSEPLASAATLAGEWVRAGGGLLAVDLASAEPLRAFGPERVRASLGRLAPDVLFANEGEAAALGGVLTSLAPVAVVKRGADGCDVGSVHVPTEPVAAADTTGAGDAFDAGFLYALLEGAAPVPAAQAGHRSAARLLTTPRAELAL